MCTATVNPFIPETKICADPIVAISLEFIDEQKTSNDIYLGLLQFLKIFYWPYHDDINQKQTKI